MNTLPLCLLTLSLTVTLTLAQPAPAAPPESPVAKKAPVQGEVWMNQRIGKDSDLLYSGQQMVPEGQMVDFGGRLCALASVGNGKFLLVKTTTQLVAVDADEFKVRQATIFPATNGGSMHGLVVAADGKTAYVTGGKDKLFRAELTADGGFHFTNAVDLAEGGKPTNPLGVAITPDGELLLVARSLPNDVVVIKLATGKIEARIPVGICPYSVVVARDGRTAFVSNYGGPRPRAGAKTEKSGGSDVAVDARSISRSGSVSVLQLEGKPRESKSIPVGLHPSEIILSPDGSRLYVANVGSDSVSVIDTATQRVVGTLNTKPDPGLPWGSLPDGLALSADGGTLYVADAGINAIACVRLAEPAAKPRLIPGGWMPGAICVRGKELFVANVRNGLQKIAPAKDEAEAQARDERAHANAHLARAIRAAERATSPAAPVPVPAQPGDPSVIKHVVYVIKENRTYDELLGDIGRGNSDPKLCHFDAKVVPNHKALATTFALLDNYYCNGVNSADGHMWCLQGLTTPMREKDRPGYRCAYDFGTDALCYAGCGFLWDQVLLAGLSFRNYGELDYPEKVGGSTYNDYYTDWKNKGGKAGFRPVYNLEALRKYSSPIFPGWEMSIPDQVRADAFLKELGEYEAKGSYPDFVILYLPNDHTSSELKAQSYLADNDLALGRCVEGLSRSKFWKDMAVFVIEDDPQAGVDHVDGHRSICLVASPWAKRGEVVSKFYNESAVLHTMGQILGLPPLNQMVAAAPLMTDCFQNRADLTPFPCSVPEFPLNTPKDRAANRAKTRAERKLDARIAKLDFTKPDQIDEDALNRLIWRETRPGEVYPVKFSGAHGRGLKALGLTLGALDGDND